MKRRRFLSWLSFSAFFSLLPSVLSSCADKQAASTANLSTAPLTPTNQRQDGFIKVGQIQDLKSAGSLSFQSTEGMNVVVVQDPGNPESLHALEPVCTHQGCNINWDQDHQSFSCPCHGSKFDLQGNVLQGPAEDPIKSYSTKVEANNILVNLG